MWFDNLFMSTMTKIKFYQEKHETKNPKYIQDFHLQKLEKVSTFCDKIGLD